jgi:predicted nucleic acid-binding protein
MSVEFVDTNIVLYSLSDDMAKRRQALIILANQPV